MMIAQLEEKARQRVARGLREALDGEDAPGLERLVDRLFEVYGVARFITPCPDDPTRYQVDTMALLAMADRLRVNLALVIAKKIQTEAELAALYQRPKLRIDEF